VGKDTGTGKSPVGSSCGKLKRNMDCYIPQQQNVCGFPLCIYFDIWINVLQ